MNTFLPARYDELVTRLAFGVEPIDAQRGGRVIGPLRIVFDECPRPLHIWRPFPPGTLLDDVLPRMERHLSGRYVRRYERGTPAQIRLRISDPRRRYVPRRFAITILTEPAIAAAEADPAVPDVGIDARVVRLSVHPGANADLSSGVTAIRGQLHHADGTVAPWARIEALRTGTGEQFGFTHGDDRGEFLLVLTPPRDTVGMPIDPVSVELVVGVAPTVVAPATDPLVPAVDPLWQLFEEPLTLPVAPPLSPATGTAADGRTFPATFVTTTYAGPFVVPAGQIRSTDLSLP